MRANLILIAALTAACARGQGPEAPVADARVVQVLSLEDLEAREAGEEAQARARAAFPEEECAVATSEIGGSFTRAGADQTMTSVTAGPCSGPGSRNELVVHEAGREVWRGDGAPAVRAVDVDGDGQDEFVKVWKDCRGDQCRAEAWLSRTSGDVLHVEDAEEQHCEAVGRVRWTSVSLLIRGRQAEVARSEHWRECR